jgi:hypothetical protein
MRLAQPFPSTEPCIRTADNDGPATTNGHATTRARSARSAALYGWAAVRLIVRATQSGSF